MYFFYLVCKKLHVAYVCFIIFTNNEYNISYSSYIFPLKLPPFANKLKIFYSRICIIKKKKSSFLHTKLEISRKITE